MLANEHHSGTENESTEHEPPRKKKKSKGRTTLFRWIKAVFFALLAAWTLRTFFFEAFQIPTPSMEDTLLTGDYVVISKIAYGPRTPVSVGIPFTSFRSESLSLPFFRFPGYATVERGDVVVFNFPPDDKVLDQKQHYIKRIAGIPGDSVVIVDKLLTVNGKRMASLRTMRQDWIMTLADPAVKIPNARLAELNVDLLTTQPDGTALIRGTARSIDTLTETDYVLSIRPYVRRGALVEVFPAGTGFNLDNYGPLVVPAKGTIFTLDAEFVRHYGRLIERFENNTVAVDSSGRASVNGTYDSTYTFSKNYYFMLGDNRDYSADSRTWGLVPEDHLVGRVEWVYFSWDKKAGFPRFDRMFLAVR